MLPSSIAPSLVTTSTQEQSANQLIIASPANDPVAESPHPITVWSLQNDSADIVKSTYERARIFYQEYNTRHRKGDPTWLLQSSTMDDALAAVHAAEAKYSLKRKGRSKASKALDSYWSKAAERVIQYRDVIDTFVSSNSEYAALAWGAIKLLFTATLNHKENSSKIAEAFVAIGETLQEMNFIASELYPSASIKRTLAIVYAHIIDFCIRAIRWYEKVTRNFFRQALAAVNTSWTLEFQDVADRIKQSSMRLREQSGVAHQVETRRIFNVVSGMKTDLGHVVQLARNQTEAPMLNTTPNLPQLPSPDTVPGSSINSSTNRKLLTLSDVPAINDWVSTLSSAIPFNPQSVLEIRNTMLDRRRSRGALPTNTEAVWKSVQLRDWISSQEPALIELQGSLTHPEASRDFALDMIGLAKSTGLPVIWYLSSPIHSSSSENTITAKDILISLIQQIVDRLQQDLTNFDVKFTQLMASDTYHDWLCLLISILHHIPRIILVIDAHNNVEQMKNITQEFWSQVASQGVSTKIKMLLLTYSTTNAPFLTGDRISHSRISVDSDRKPGTARASLHGTSPKGQRVSRARRSNGPAQFRPFMLQLFDSG